MLSPENLRTLELDRDYGNLTSFPKKSGAPLIIVTDYEGPIELGDPVDLLMKKINPRLYMAIYNCFTIDRLNGRFDPKLAQEAHDTIFTLPFFAALGLRNESLIEAADISRMTPGAKETIQFLRSENALVVAVTSAPELMYKKRAEELGIDGIIGTSFPLDEVVNALKDSGRYAEEIGIVNSFLNDVNNITRLADETSFVEALHDRLNKYLDDLGVLFNPYQRSKRGPVYKSIFGQVMEARSTVGDYSKEEIASLIFSNNASLNTVSVTVGDGENDRRMLAANRRSLAINGPTAILDATFGAFTPDVSWVQVPYYEFNLRNPDATEGDILRHLDTVLKRNHPKEYDDETVRFHLGGSHLQGTIYQDKHRQSKRALRGDIIN